MDIYNSDFQHEIKNNEVDNFITNADKKSELFIKKELEKEFPNHGFRAEEYNNDSSDKEFVWIIDPIDGTKGFVNKTDEFSIMIGLAHNGKSILGVVFNPAKNHLFYAEKGKGAFFNGERIYVSEKNNVEDMKLVVSDRFKKFPVLKTMYDKLPVKFTIIGSAGYKICLIAQSLFDIAVYKDNTISEWDMCAPKIIVEEAGGIMTFFNNEEVKFNRKETKYSQGILISNNKNHKELLSLLTTSLN